MTSQSIISTKLNIPFLRANIVSRPRIVEILHDGLERGVSITLISAPAGYGKTTLLAGWLRSVDQQVAWLSIEPEDDTYARFITYLIASLQKVHPSIGVLAGQLLEASQGDSASLDTIVPSLINDLAGLSQPLILVLEDYHFIQSAAIHDTVRMLIDHMPPQLRCVITTRQDPPLPLARWRARYQLIEIRTQDLQFNLEEATEFLRYGMELDLPDGDITLLEQRTEGWAAGLQLAALSIRNRKQGSGSWKLEAGRRDIADYLLQEIFSQSSTERQEFLLKTSLVSRLSASLCNAITDRTDSQSLLESLDADNLFVTALDDRRKWFRYHHLFEEFLRHRLIVEFSVSAVQELHQRASHWFASNGDMLSAIDHALAAEDFDYAACLIAPQSQQWMRHGEVSTILKYLNQLPRDFVWNQWEMCLWYGWAFAARGELNAAVEWTNRLEALITPLIQDATLKENGPIPSELQSACAQVLAIRSIIARQNKDFVSAIELSEQALRLVPDENRNLQTIISALLSSAVLEAGHFDQAESLLHSTRQRAYRTGNAFIAFTLLLNESALAVMRGQLQRAHDLNEEALRLAQTASMERLVFLPQMRLGRVYYFWNQLAQARQYLTAAIVQADVVAYPNPTVRGYITLAWIQDAEGQYQQALQTLADAERLALDRCAWEALEMVRGVRAQLQFSAGENEAVTRWARSSDWETFDSSERPGLILSDESFFPYCQNLIASGEPPKVKRAERLLAWRLKDSKLQRRESTILKICLVQALLHHSQNQPDLVMNSLLQALEIAMPENCIRPFLDEGQQLFPYLRRVPREHSLRNFAQKILAGFSTSTEHPQLIDPLSQQEFNILQLMAQGHTNPEIARKLVLAVSTVRWYVRQIFRKLGVHNRTQAATQAKTLNLI